MLGKENVTYSSLIMFRYLRYSIKIQWAKYAITHRKRGCSNHVNESRCMYRNFKELFKLKSQWSTWWCFASTLFQSIPQATCLAPILFKNFNHSEYIFCHFRSSCKSIILRFKNHQVLSLLCVVSFKPKNYFSLNLQGPRDGPLATYAFN